MFCGAGLMDEAMVPLLATEYTSNTSINCNCSTCTARTFSVYRRLAYIASNRATSMVDMDK